jgi:hypothetical protein
MSASPRTRREGGADAGYAVMKPVLDKSWESLYIIGP